MSGGKQEIRKVRAGSGKYWEGNKERSVQEATGVEGRKRIQSEEDSHDGSWATRRGLTFTPLLEEVGQ